MRVLMSTILIAVACLSLNLSMATAEDLTVTRTAVAVQTITVPDYSPLLLLLPPESELTASGPLVFEFTDNPPRTISMAADFTTTDPFPLWLGAVDFPGLMVKNGNRFELTSFADFEVNTVLPLGQNGELVPLRLFVLETAVFIADVPGVGFPPGTLFKSPEKVALGLEINGFVFNDANGNPIPMAFSSNRTVTIVNPSED